MKRRTKVLSIALVRIGVMEIGRKSACCVGAEILGMGRMQACFHCCGTVDVAMERTLVRCFMYPAFLSPPPTLSFADQFAFRPTGSPAAAIISLLNIINLLTSNPFVTVISLDFSKAFDTVRHSTLLEKLAQLDMPANAYNWLVDSFSGHSHCTVYCGQTSMLN